MEFDLKELTAKALFDYVGPEFPAWFANNRQKFILPSLKGIGRDLLLGKPYFQTLKLAYNGEEFPFPNEPLISLSLQKTIVETATVGKERKGTVKEYICTEDYQLAIKGVCFNTDAPGEYPTDQVQKLQQLFEINDSLEILSNPFLLLFDIKNLVLKSIDWQEMAGQQGLQIYNITAVSDSDFYADLSDQGKFLQSLSSGLLLPK
jgi:hypothetical protein